MNCPKCKTKLKTRHTYRLESGKTATMECESCLRVFTVVSLLYGEAENGSGAYALSQRVKAGEDLKEIAKEAE